jgi:ATP-dependent DNA helicase DinG
VTVIIVLDDDLKATIQKAYSRFLEAKGLRGRQGQRMMIAEVARLLGHIPVDAEGQRTGGPHVCAIEAGTGTGKTVAYALAAIPAAKALEKRLVIATATVALQEQIVFKDLPDLRRHSGLTFDFALAKGRGRYACLYKLDFQLAHGSEQGLGTQALYPDEREQILPDASLKLYHQLLDTLGDGSWDGDRDSLQRMVPDDDWQRLVTDHSQCTGRRCAYISQCPFFRARESLAGVDVVVVNHDLVLADLALGGGAILPSPEETIYIFDEGHHLPEKAVQHFSAHTRLQGSQRWLQNATRQLTAVAQMLPGSDSLQAALRGWPECESVLSEAHEAVARLVEELLQHQPRDKGERQLRFAGGVVPAALRAQARVLARAWIQAGERLRQVSSVLEAQLDSRPGDVPRELVEQAYTAVGGLWQRCGHGEALWMRYANEDDTDDAPTARWLTVLDHGNTVDIEVCASPVLPVQALQTHVWERCFAAVLTSATLTALGSFDRLRQRAGLPDDTLCSVVPSPFDYAGSADLVVPPDAADGGQAEVHTQALVGFMASGVDRAAATLVLFSSRRQMNDVYEAVTVDFRECVLLQDHFSKQQLLQLHRERIDRSEPSVIFGLASFAEGVDLPGDYLKHVVIAKIPFASPANPVEQTLSEWIETQGGNPFMQIAVADASLRLVQAAGRLLRTESDTGRITILDRRLVTKRYGRALLDSLPPYRRVLN